MNQNTIFPHPNSASEEGVLAVGGDYSEFMLLTAYHQGIFPWPIPPNYPYIWFSPDPRAVIDFDSFKINTTTKKLLKKKIFTTKINTDAREIILGCKNSKNRQDGNSTWLTKELSTGFFNLFKLGHVYTVGAYNAQDQLVGGVFGVKLKNIATAESMFYLESGASKYALVRAINYLQNEGHEWVDVQMVTETTKSFGAKEIPREDFLKRIKHHTQKW